MKEVGKHLYDLQQIDLTLSQHQKRLQSIETELANHAPVQKAKKLFAAAEAKLKPLQTDLRDLELQVETTKRKRDGSEKRLYSGTVSNPKELQDIEQNIASLKRWQSELEDKQLELMMTIESAQELLDSAQNNLKQVMSDAATSNTDLLAEQEKLNAELLTLSQERETLAGQLEASDLVLYEDLRPKMANRPIAIMSDERNCSICGVQQTNLHAQTIKQSDDLVRCASCNRILISY